MIQERSSSSTETRQIPRNNLPVVQWLVQWQNLPPDAALWEDAYFIKHTFPALLCSTVQAWFAAEQAP